MQNGFDAQEMSNVSSGAIQICEFTIGDGRKHDGAMYWAITTKLARVAFRSFKEISMKLEVPRISM